MKRCTTCKYWYNEQKDEYNEIIHPEDPDTFEPMRNLPFEVRYCHSPKITFYERPVELDGATLLDGSGYQAGLITAPLFGCVHWIRREE